MRSTAPDPSICIEHSRNSRNSRNSSEAGRSLTDGHSDQPSYRHANLVGTALGGLGVAMALVLLVGTLMRNQAVLEFDGAQTSQHLRIKSFASEIRVAADALRDDRGDCSAGPESKRNECLRNATRTSRSAVAAARARYDVRRVPVADARNASPDASDLPAASSDSNRPAPARR